jgi:hypothetical protein
MGAMIRHPSGTHSVVPTLFDKLTDELRAMQEIANALGALPDQATRVRVIRWMAERFGANGDVVFPATTAPAATTATTAPSVPRASGARAPGASATGAAIDLGMDALEELFVAPLPDSRDTGSHDSDYWRVESAEPQARTIDGAPSQDGAPSPCAADDKARAAAAPVESMIHSFVADFQKLADEWSRG